MFVVLMKMEVTIRKSGAGGQPFEVTMYFNKKFLIHSRKMKTKNYLHFFAHLFRGLYGWVME